MQIDFHFGVTYLVARMAGIPAAQAQIIAHSAQYVDDATNEGLILFSNRMIYQRIASAHRMLDYRNFDELSDHYAWIPFHFLPGNQGQAAPKTPLALSEAEFMQRMICRPNSLVAQEMVAHAITARHAPWGLHGFGIALHVYVDTWAHQGFCGLQHHYNRISDVQDYHGAPHLPLLNRLKSTFTNLFDEVLGEMIEGVLPLGHGGALSFPDLPYLSWQYTSPLDGVVSRNNTILFREAAEHLYIACRRFVLNDTLAEVVVPQAQFAQIAHYLASFTEPDGHARLKHWLNLIASGTFSCVAGNAICDHVQYLAKGKGSWKYIALGDVDEVEDKDKRHPFTPQFLNSDWKHFHDALMWHRQYVLYDLLPRYGLLAA